MFPNSKTKIKIRLNLSKSRLQMSEIKSKILLTLKKRSPHLSITSNKMSKSQLQDILPTLPSTLVRENCSIRTALLEQELTGILETRSKGTQTTVRYIAASSDKFEQTADDQLLVPFNDVVSDAVGAATKKGGITASVDGKYQVTATVAGVKGTIVFVKVFDRGLNSTPNQKFNGLFKMESPKKLSVFMKQLGTRPVIPSFWI